MSDLKILQALRTLLRTVTISGLSNDDISYLDPPKPFDPKNKALWLSEGFVPASSESMGKTKASSDEDRGFYQITIFTPLLGGDFGLTTAGAIDNIKTVFFNGASIVYDGQKVDILDVTAQGQSESESWLSRVVTINYLTFSERI